MINSFIGAEKYKVTHSNGRHQFYADEPVEKGGMDTAPTPDELLESALASCTLVTLRMYTDHKQWNVGSIDLSVSLKREDGKTIITRQLKFEHQLSEVQIQRLVQVAKNCPVSKTLSAASELNVEII
ncbi:OsmC family protein [Lacibacter sp. H375]|uniref:OsmC family protein n=1 Tax=Lacibacter sp. H375 TaxID=3133424 RepID=UPI0030BC0294